MMRALKFSLLGVLVLFLLIVGTVTWVLNDEVLLRRQVESRVSASLGRNLTVEMLELDLGKVTNLRLQGIRLANAEWAGAPQLLSIGNLRASIDFSRLLERGVEIQVLEIVDAELNLEEDAAGQENWRFGPRDEVEDKSPREKLIPWTRLHLSQFELTHRAPDREVPLDFRIGEMTATRSTAGRVDVDGSGVIGGYALEVDGFVEPLDALVGGGRISHRLTVELGENRLISEGTVEDSATGAGANIGAEFTGPDFGWLLQQAALPEFSSGPFDISLSLSLAADQSLELDLDGDLGSLEATASGRIDRLARPSMIDLAFEISGPDLQSLGETMGVETLPTLPYRVQGELMLEQGALEVEQFLAEIDKDRVSVSGSVGPWPGLEGTSLDISASGTDVSAWGPSTGFQNLPPSFFSLSGHFLEQDGRIAVHRGKFTLGESVLHVDGKLGSMPDLVGTRLDVALMVPDLSRVARRDALQLPQAPVRLSGSLRREQAGILVEGLGIELLENTAQLSGLVVLKPGPIPAGAEEWRGALSGSRLSADVAVPDAGALGELFGRPGVPEYALDVQLTAHYEDGVLGLEAGEGSLGDARFSFNGELALEPSVQIRSAQVSASGPEFRHFYDRGALKGLPGRFRLEGEVEPREGEIRIQGLSLRLGASQITLEGEVNRLPDLQSGNLTAEMEIADLEELHPFLVGFTERPLPAGTLSLNASIAGDWQQIDITGISAVLGESDLNGHLVVAPGAVPEILGSFESETLDLTWLGDENSGAMEAATAGSATGSVRVFSDEALPLLGLKPVYLDIGFQADEVRLRLATFSDVNLGFAMTADEVSLHPLELSGQAGEKLSGSVFLRQKGDVIEADVNANARSFRFGLGLAEGQDIISAPPIDLFSKLTVSGASMREIAGTAAGHIELILGKGQVANNRLNLIFSDIALELLHKINPFTKESAYTNVDCGVAMVQLANGQARVDPLILQTDKIVATSAGTVDLDSEKIELGFSTRPRRGIGISPGIVINPFIKLGGTMAQPSMSLDPTGAAVSGGAAVATSGLSLLGKSLFDRFLRERDPCGKVVAELRRMRGEDAAEP